MKSVIVKNISKSYEKVQAVKDISFEVEKGELFGLIGPDGAGKTTIFRILTSLLLPDQGEASMENLNVVSDYKIIRKITGYMPGRFSLYQDLTVEENLNFFATVFGVTVDENYELIKNIFDQIAPFKKRLAGKLSGGMKQKLALSCALIHKPKVLILDEPTTGVDAVSRKEIWEMLQDLKTKGITILVSTPYMDEASLCDQVALIQHGNIMEINSPEKIISKFKHNLYSLKTANKQKLIDDLRSFEHSNSVFAFGDSIHYTDKRKNIEIQVIVNYLKNKNHSTIEAEKIKPNIEDCFMDLMKN
ncbi:MAG: ABC transporter ATP-binding protein [Bacteroidales bacterium]|nr:ABC transporter ATP-binding protein [Bacteroidales bacterium]